MNGNFNPFNSNVNPFNDNSSFNMSSPDPQNNSLEHENVKKLFEKAEETLGHTIFVEEDYKVLKVISEVYTKSLLLKNNNVNNPLAGEIYKQGQDLLNKADLLITKEGANALPATALKDMLREDYVKFNDEIFNKNSSAGNLSESQKVKALNTQGYSMVDQNGMPGNMAGYISVFFILTLTVLLGFILACVLFFIK